MKINIEFESWTELCKFLSTASAEDMPDFTKVAPKKLTAKELTESAKVTEEIINRAEAKEKAEKAAEEPEEPAKAEESEAPAEEPVSKPAKEKKADPEALKVKARKTLAKVNKKTGENTAKEWINEKGFESLSDIDDPDVLDDLITMAEGFLNA